MFVNGRREIITLLAAAAERARQSAFAYCPDYEAPGSEKVATSGADERVSEMGRQVAVALYVLAMVSTIVGSDLMFFRDRFWERLMVNIGTVLVFGAFYLRFLKPS